MKRLVRAPRCVLRRRRSSVAPAARRAADDRSALPPQPADVAGAQVRREDRQAQRRVHEACTRSSSTAPRGRRRPALPRRLDHRGLGRQRQGHLGSSTTRKYKPANFGIGGDRTQHVLWRIENGELDGDQAEGRRPDDRHEQQRATTRPEQIAAGVEKIVERPRGRRPARRCCCWPSSRAARTPEKAADAARDDQAASTRRSRSSTTAKTVRYLDLSDKFLQPDGTISKEIMPDYLHLSKKGYEIWADAMDPLLAEMIEVARSRETSPIGSA